MKRYLYLILPFYFYLVINAQWPQSTPLLNHCKPNHYDHYTLNLLNYSQVFFYNVARAGFMEGADHWGPKNCSWDVRCPKHGYVVGIDGAIRGKVILPENVAPDEFEGWPKERCNEMPNLIIQYEEDVHCYYDETELYHTTKTNMARIRISAPKPKINQSLEFICRAFCLYADTLKIPLVDSTVWTNLMYYHTYN